MAAVKTVLIGGTPQRVSAELVVQFQLGTDRSIVTKIFTVSEVQDSSEGEVLYELIDEDGALYKVGIPLEQAVVEQSTLNQLLSRKGRLSNINRAEGQRIQETLAEITWMLQQDISDESRTELLASAETFNDLQRRLDELQKELNEIEDTVEECSK